MSDMRYVQSKIRDTNTHFSNIEKIYYFSQIDKVVLYEQGLNKVYICDAKTMVYEKTIECDGTILAVEFCADKNALAVSLSDRTIVFYDVTKHNNQNVVRWLYVPSTQKCLTYSQRK
jgi:hypothetical protein